VPTIKKANWRVSYLGATGGALRLGQCDYAGVRAIHSAAVPFVYVDYKGSTTMFTDTLTVSEAGVEVREVMNGFDLRAAYDFGEDYRYEHVWRFHDDGQFGSTIVIQGPGEEIRGRHTYHLPFRFDIDVSGSANDSFQTRSAAGRWVDVAKEGRQQPVRVPDWDWRVADKTSGRSAKMRARVGDDAEVWAFRFKPGESLSAAGGLSLEHPPGSPGSVPAIYDNGQGVQDTNVVLWYIAHISAYERVAACGPWVKLEGYPPVPSEPDEPHM
jgi:hypothetical protein